MKMLKNLMAVTLVLAFVFVVGAQGASAKPTSNPPSEGSEGMRVPSNSAHTDNCMDCHPDTNYASHEYGFEEGEMCARCHITPEDAHAYSGGNATPEKPAAVHGLHNVYVPDDAEKRAYDDCVGCHVNPADATDLNGDGLINDPVGPAPAEDDNAGPYVPTADTDNNPLTPKVSYLTPHMDEETPMFGGEDCGICHDGAKIPATPTTDGDGDGLTYDIEEILGTSDEVPNQEGHDSDQDEMSDLDEVNYSAKRKVNLDPMDPDTDGDGMKDGYEVENGDRDNGWKPCEDNSADFIADPNVPPTSDGAEDTPVLGVDGAATGTIEDMSLDFIPTFTVPAQFGTVTFEGATWTYTLNPATSFADEAEPISDFFTVKYMNTNGKFTTYTAYVSVAPAAEPPIDTDSDGQTDDVDTDDDSDGFSDEEEIAAGTDPLDETSFPEHNHPPIDTDSDGQTDDVDTDDDGDGFTDEEEIAAGTDPLDETSFPEHNHPPIDTDSDGQTDDVDTDDDGDGFSDEEEIAAGTDPLNEISFPEHNHPPTDTDSDGQTDNVDTDDDNDGFSDEEEIAAGTDPLDEASFPEDNTDRNTAPSGTNPETGGNAGLALFFGVTAISSSGLVIFRKRK